MMEGLSDMKFRSKIDWWGYLLFTLFIFMSILLFIQKSNIVGTVVFLLNATIVIPVYVLTYYILEEEYLVIRCGFFKKRIKYSEIMSIKETRSSMASAALSLDRIEIKYKTSNMSDTVLISPVNKEYFLKELANHR